MIQCAHSAEFGVMKTYVLYPKGPNKRVFFHGAIVVYWAPSPKIFLLVEDLDVKLLPIAKSISPSSRAFQGRLPRRSSKGRRSCMISAVFVNGPLIPGFSVSSAQGPARLGSDNCKHLRGHLWR